MLPGDRHGHRATSRLGVWSIVEAVAELVEVPDAGWTQLDPRQPAMPGPAPPTPGADTTARRAAGRSP
jgi:hypothetical protein